MKNNKNALETTNLNFYGDELVAIKDISTGEVYTSINAVLRNIGFTETQIRYQRDKWVNDLVISKGVLKINIPTSSGIQLTECISRKKLPLALAKINLSVKTRNDYPEVTLKLALYQDKCADVLASAFIGHSLSTIQMDQLTETLSELNNKLAVITQNITMTMNYFTEINSRLTNIEQQLNKPKKKFSYWSTKMFPKYQALTDYLHITHKQLYGIIFKKLQDTYPDVDLNQLVEDYCYENDLENCYTLDAIEHDKEIRRLYESTVDEMMIQYGLE